MKVSEVNNKFMEIFRQENLHNAIKAMKTTKYTAEQMSWLGNIMKILKSKGYARVMAKGCLIDIASISNQNMDYASFADAINFIDKFYTNVPPVRIENLKNKRELLYEKDDCQLW